MLLEKSLKAKSFDDEQMTAETKKLAAAYIEKFDADKDGKLNRKEAQTLLEDTFDVSQRITPLHGGLKDDIMAKEITHNYMVHEYFWNRYGKGDDLDAEKMYAELRDILYNAFKNADHMNKQPACMNSYV